MILLFWLIDAKIGKRGRFTSNVRFLVGNQNYEFQGSRDPRETSSLKFTLLDGQNTACKPLERLILGL